MTPLSTDAGVVEVVVVGGGTETALTGAGAGVDVVVGVGNDVGVVVV
jgi:hypothetical protein